MNFGDLARLAAKKEYFAAYVLLLLTVYAAFVYSDFDRARCERAAHIVDFAFSCQAEGLPVSVVCENQSEFYKRIYEPARALTVGAGELQSRANFTGVETAAAPPLLAPYENKAGLTERPETSEASATAGG